MSVRHPDTRIYIVFPTFGNSYDLIAKNPHIKDVLDSIDYRYTVLSGKNRFATWAAKLRLFSVLLLNRNVIVKRVDPFVGYGLFMRIVLVLTVNI